MSQETIAMSSKERERMVVMGQVQRGELLLKEAAFLLGVSARQAVRIKKRFAQQGAEGLVHQSRGMPSHRRKGADFRRGVLDLYRQSYGDFGPTLAAEKMLEREGLQVNRETLRRWLIGERLWQVGVKGRVHRLKRPRRERFGELLQIDGSDHEWLEERGPRSTLMVLVDDATGRIALHMAAAETTHAALAVLHKWVKSHGVPVALYADRRTVYFTEQYVQSPERRKDPSVFTDFMKAADRLGIEMIPAYSPQAKGRIERVNGTLQDRLVRELRLAGVSSIEGANALLDDFARAYNERFAREPARAGDAHRLAPRGKERWAYFFCTETVRVVAKDNTVRHRGDLWQILAQPRAPRPGARVTYRTPLEGEAQWLWREKPLKIKHLGRARR